MLHCVRNQPGGVEFNFLPLDMVQRIPGVSSKNCKRLMRSTHNLADLCDLTSDQLSTARANTEHGKTIWNFLNSTI